MKKNTILWAGVAAAALLLFKKKSSGVGAINQFKAISMAQDRGVDMTKEVADLSTREKQELDNIRRGVANGWYKAKRTMVNGKPAVELSGRTQDGKLYTDVYPVSLETYNKLT